MFTSTLIDHFPEGFTPYPHQIKALEDIEKALNKKTKYIIIQAPTGSGKSFISKTLANYTNSCDPEYERLVFNYYAYDESYFDRIKKFTPHGLFALTTTKALQNQYKELFGDSSIFKGKSNYQCSIDPDCAVDFAPCITAHKLKRSCWNDHVCPYYEARNNALIDKFTVLNYAAFLNLPSHLQKRQIIVADECSELEDELVKKFSTEIDYKKLTRYGIKYSKLMSEDPRVALGWLTDLSNSIHDAIKAHTNRSNYENTKGELMKQRVRKDLFESISLTINNWHRSEYIIEKDGFKATFTPLKVDRLASCIFDHSETVILMSATIVDKDMFAKTLGITDFTYIEVDSVFDPKKSPIYCHTKYPLSYKTLAKNLPPVIELTQQLCDNHKNEKGIIHTHSFAITQAVQKTLKGNRYLYREEGSTNEHIIKEHVIRSGPTVLISPSLTMGLDLKGDLGKWQVIVKLPYPSLASKRVKKMFENNNDWYRMKMLVALIQTCGRCTRSVEDESSTYILDGLSAKTILDNKFLLPKHFIDRIV